jgi:hypothetical protein
VELNSDGEGMLKEALVAEKDRPEYTYRPDMPLAKLLNGDAPTD